MNGAEALSAAWSMVGPPLRRAGAALWFSLLPLRLVGLALVILGGVVATIGYGAASLGALVANGPGEKGRRIAREIWQ